MVDSHEGIPHIEVTKEELLSSDLIPFQKAAKARVELIMLGHLQIDCLDSQFPSTFSRETYRFLRDQLKYRNLIITDDMQMGAVVKTVGLEHHPAVHALMAGADLVLYRNYEESYRALEAIKKAIVDKGLTYQDLEQKWSRQMKAKKMLGKRDLVSFLKKAQEVCSSKSH